LGDSLHHSWEYLAEFSMDELAPANGWQYDITGRLERIIRAWIAARAQHSKNATAVRSYELTLTTFRTFLQAQELDLDSDPVTVADAARQWARLGNPAPATYKNRLSMISSFYQYGRASGLLIGENPIDWIDRRFVSATVTRQAPSTGAIIHRQSPLNRSLLTHLRDHALLAVSLTTFRRAAELARLRWSDVDMSDNAITLAFRDSRTDITEATPLVASVSQALMTYVQIAYGTELAELPAHAALWISTSPRNFGRAITAQAIADIYRKHLGASQLSVIQEHGTQALAAAEATLRKLQNQVNQGIAMLVDRHGG
jgi:site-specific recombinase XerD